MRYLISSFFFLGIMVSSMATKLEVQEIIDLEEKAKEILANDLAFNHVKGLNLDELRNFCTEIQSNPQYPQTFTPEVRGLYQRLIRTPSLYENLWRQLRFQTGDYPPFFINSGFQHMPASVVWFHNHPPTVDVLEPIATVIEQKIKWYKKANDMSALKAATLPIYFSEIIPVDMYKLRAVSKFLNVLMYNLFWKTTKPLPPASSHFEYVLSQVLNQVSWGHKFPMHPIQERAVVSFYTRLKHALYHSETQIKELLNTYFNNTQTQTYMALSSNFLTDMPTNVLYSKKLSFLPDHIWCLKTLSGLCIEDTPISTLSPLIHRLQNLLILKLNRNGLKRLPDTMGQLTKLTELDVSQNQLEELPPQLGSLTSLQSLSIDYNPLSHIPPLQALKLKVVDIQGTLINLQDAQFRSNLPLGTRITYAPGHVVENWY